MSRQLQYGTECFCQTSCSRLSFPTPNDRPLSSPPIEHTNRKCTRETLAHTPGSKAHSYHSTFCKRPYRLSNVPSNADGVNVFVCCGAQLIRHLLTSPILAIRCLRKRTALLIILWLNVG